MSRLIDADKMIERLKEWNTSDSIDKALYNFAMNRVIEQPTAYDPDKVVEQLEIEKSTANNTYIAYEMKVVLGRVFGLEKAIEIVKGGGVNE